MSRRVRRLISRVRGGSVSIPSGEMLTFRRLSMGSRGLYDRRSAAYAASHQSTRRARCVVVLLAVPPPLSRGSQHSAVTTDDRIRLLEYEVLNLHSALNSLRDESLNLARTNLGVKVGQFCARSHPCAPP